MVVITLSAIAVQLAELQTRLDRPSTILFNTTDGNDTVSSEIPTKMQPVYFWVADFLFVLLTLFELILKVSFIHSYIQYTYSIQYNYYARLLCEFLLFGGCLC